jgi:ADP-heptose:LPS heptosyltransferase
VEVEQVSGLDLQKDLESLSSLIGSCDLVISIDNTTAHLSAAIGAPTWVLLPLACDWRWQEKVVNDPIYGYQSAKTYQQIESGQWDAVFDMLRKDFNNFINLKSLN